jgi:hypothetical protein
MRDNYERMSLAVSSFYEPHTTDRKRATGPETAWTASSQRNHAQARTTIRSASIIQEIGQEQWDQPAGSKRPVGADSLSTVADARRLMSQLPMRLG